MQTDYTISVELSNNVKVQHAVSIYVRAPDEIIQPGDDLFIDKVLVAHQKDTCKCNVGIPLYPGGNQLFIDSLIKTTTKQIRPSKTGTICVRFTITENGELVKPEIIKSIDPKFETKLLANMLLMGKWIPVCELSPEPEFDTCEGRKPVSVVLQLPIKIEAAR